MKKVLLYTIAFLSLAHCYRIPQREEIEFRSTLETAMVETFPKKVIVVIHPFDNLSKGDTDRAYLEDAIPDQIEAMLEPLRSTLAYIPFDGMPFYVSEEISNLFQNVDSEEDEEEEAKIDAFGNVIVDDDEDEDGDDEDGDTNDSIFDDEDDEDEDDEDEENKEESYFSYLTNYLRVVPTQETQFHPETSTNTNYFQMFTNIDYVNGVIETNLTSNEILLTTTNDINTNVVIVNKNLLTPTNMLILLYEEFPTLTNYLSFLPIEIRRATDRDKVQFADQKLRSTNPAQWRAAQRKKAQEDTNLTVPDLYPKDSFEYIYHVGGNFRTRRSDNLVRAIDVSILMQIYPVYSTGDIWWENSFQSPPPVLSKILNLLQSLDPNDPNSFKSASLRTPFKRPLMTPRLQDEFEIYSTNYRDTKPATPENPLAKRTKPLSLRINVPEPNIPIAITEWLKYFHALIVNRPYTALRVQSNPPGTLVYLNGFYIGTTPLIYPTAPIGAQRVAFLKDGYNREEIFVDILPNQTNSLTYTLQSLNNTGTLAVTASIPDAEIYINSQYKGIAPLIISNLTLDQRYRVEILNPKSDLSSNRNSVYTDITLTEQKSSITFDAQFKDFETNYRTRKQKALLAATYVSWFATIGLMGASIYTQYRFKEAEDLLNAFGTPDPNNAAQVAQHNKYRQDVTTYAVASQATLYSSIAAALLSTGIMGWYLHSKEIYLGLDVNPEKNEWYAKFKLKF